MIKYYCDKCKSEINYCEHFGLKEVGLTKILPRELITDEVSRTVSSAFALTTKIGKEEYTFTLCKKCSEKFAKFMKDNPNEIRFENGRIAHD